MRRNVRQERCGLFLYKSYSVCDKRTLYTHASGGSLEVRCGQFGGDLARAPNSPMLVECRGEVGCVFDEIGNLVEPNERPDMDVRGGPQRGRMPERRGTNSLTRRRIVKSLTTGLKSIVRLRRCRSRRVERGRWLVTFAESITAARQLALEIRNHWDVPTRTCL
jgi:hypothetical protein